MTRFLYLSPHLDDVVLSAGGAIASRLEAGDEVVVATVFSGPPNSEECEEALLYSERRAEDQKAISQLIAQGSSPCEAHYLGLADAPFRDSRYSSFDAIINGPSSTDTETRGTLRARLCEVVKREAPDVLVSPLAVGRHIDHRLVFEECAALNWEGERRFYEDRPYAFVPGAVNRRWASVGAHPESFQAEQTLKAYPQGSFLAGYRNDADTQRDTREVQRWRWNNNLFEQTRMVPTERQVRRRTLAIAAYESQLAALFDAVPETAEEAIDALYNDKPEVEWRVCAPPLPAAVVTLPAKES